jgi:hypothetical protein
VSEVAQIPTGLVSAVCIGNAWETTPDAAVPQKGLSANRCQGVDVASDEIPFQGFTGSARLTW